MKYSINPTVTYIFIITLGLSVSACSKNLGRITGLGTKADTESYLHIHPANNCIGVVEHTHINGKKKHQHYFHKCGKVSKQSNAHTHRSSSSITGYIRHVHPNGANEHTHTGLNIKK